MRMPRCAKCGEKLNVPADKNHSRFIHRLKDLPCLRGVTEVGWHAVCFSVEREELRECFRDRFGANQDEKFAAFIVEIARRGTGRVVNSRGLEP